MRTKIERVACDLCKKEDIVMIPGTDPHEWVSFWDDGPHGVNDTEFIVCNCCAREIAARYNENHDPTND